MFLVNLKMAWAAIRSARLRSFLTMIAVIIGVGSYVVVTTTVEGLKSSAAQEINELGGNLVTINSGNLIIEDESGERQVNFAAGFGASTLTEKDFNDVRQLEGIRAAAPQSLISGVVQRNDRPLDSAFILASTSDYPAAFGQEVAEGVFFSDDAERDQFVVIGSGIKETLLPGGGNALGLKLTIRGEEFVINGVMEPFESSFSFGPVDLNNAVIIPLSAAKTLTDSPAFIQEIDLQLEEGADADTVVAEIESTLLNNHGGEKDFTVLKQDELIELSGSLLDTIKGASQALSYVMLFVGAVVILLIMLISVTERIREIGIRKSIGATNNNILSQFLIEAVMLSWVGSVLGIALAFALGFVIEATVDIKPSYTSGTLLSVMIISTMIGAVAGIYPAWQAARKDPVEALRHE